jgi:hypothetical protein
LAAQSKLRQQQWTATVKAAASYSFQTVTVYWIMVSFCPEHQLASRLLQ